MRFFLIQDPEHERQFIECAQRCENIAVSTWRSTDNPNPIWVFRTLSYFEEGEWVKMEEYNENGELVKVNTQ